MTLSEEFGSIDIYLFDQLLRGRITPGMRIFDAGCGYGRNLIYLLRHGYEVFGVDANPGAIAGIRDLTRALAAGLPPGNFRAEPIESTTFSDNSADVVLASAVLHFAENEAHFDAMLSACWRVLKPGGMFFSRLASSIGIEGRIRPIRGRRALLPDGSERFLVDEELLMRLTESLGGVLLDPLKTTVVQNQRAMTTWVLRKQ